MFVQVAAHAKPAFNEALRTALKAQGLSSYDVSRLIDSWRHGKTALRVPAAYADAVTEAKQRTRGVTIKRIPVDARLDGPKRKPLGNFAPGTRLEAMDETRTALLDADKALQRSACDEARAHVAQAERWLKTGAQRGFTSAPLTAMVDERRRDLRTCKPPRAKRKSWFRR